MLVLQSRVFPAIWAALEFTEGQSQRKWDTDTAPLIERTLAFFFELLLLSKAKKRSDRQLRFIRPTGRDIAGNFDFWCKSVEPWNLHRGPIRSIDRE
jgi:hypothetical protein